MHRFFIRVRRPWRGAGPWLGAAGMLLLASCARMDSAGPPASPPAPDAASAGDLDRPEGQHSVDVSIGYGRRQVSLWRVEWGGQSLSGTVPVGP